VKRRDGTGRDGTGRDGTGRDGTEWDGTGRNGTEREFFNGGKFICSRGEREEDANDIRIGSASSSAPNARNIGQL